MSNYLYGLEDVPKISDDRCSDCNEILTKENFSGWFTFIKNDEQIYQVPICDNCNKKNSAEGGTVEE